MGRYWYDAARPNRMTNVTLETAPGAIQALTGTRALAYAFDDLKAGAQSVNGTSLGNGNLEYTVSHDTVNNRHSVRFESYTSFNMPKQFTYANFLANTTTCPAGYTLTAGNCVGTVTTANPATVTAYTCPAGYTLGGTLSSSTCTQVTPTGTNTALAIPSAFSCPVGQTLSGSNCLQSTTVTTAPGTSNTTDRTLDFVYGPEHQRIRQSVTLSGNGTSSYFAGNTWYLNGADSLGLSYEKEVRANGTTEHKHYVSAGGVTFALFTSRTGTLNGLAATSRSYFHHDHLGSIAVVTDELGAVTERLAYDPWGKRRFINSAAGTPDTLDAIVGQKTDRGFTMHEHLDEIGIVHMNGRVYDPLIGRFMSADPMVEAPLNLKSYNRYAYIWNNPLSAADPSGFCFICDPFKSISDTLHHWGNVLANDPVARTVVGVAVAYFTAGAATSFFIGEGAFTLTTAGLSLTTGASIATGAFGGFAAGFVSSGGNFEAGLQGMLTGGMFGYVGGATIANTPGSYVGHAAAGCISAAAGGGNCGQGALSAVFGKFTTNEIGSNSALSGPIAKGVASAVAGGIGSTIAGGNFENGAVTAALWVFV